MKEKKMMYLGIIWALFPVVAGVRGGLNLKTCQLKRKMRKKEKQNKRKKKEKMYLRPR